MSEVSNGVVRLDRQPARPRSSRPAQARPGRRPGDDDHLPGGPSDQAVRLVRERSGAVHWLGAELRRLRLELGISQRKLTKLLGLSAHSNLGEYERGSRIPPCDIIVACERLLAVQPGYLQRLRKLALRERARAGSVLPAPHPGED